MPADPRLAVLAALFSYPDASRYREDVEGCSVLPPELRRALKSASGTALEGEYVRLFINALPEVPCPPYASVYLEGALMGESAARVRDAYRRWGVDTDEMPDHFAVECAFLGELGGALDRDATAAADFDRLLGHLAAWAPEFLDRVEQHDRSGVYREAARFARDVIEDQLARCRDPLDAAARATARRPSGG